MKQAKSLVILGAGGHGKVAAECAEAMGIFEHIAFLDSHYPNKKHLEVWPVIGHSDNLTDFDVAAQQLFVAIGDNRARAEIYQEATNKGFEFATLVHPSAYVSRYSTIGEGTLIAAHATINPFSHIGENCIVNTGATVDHDCVINNHVHIAPGCHLAGTVFVGNSSFIGIGSRVIPNIRIDERVTVGAGSTVIKDLPAQVTVVGTPAKQLK